MLTTAQAAAQLGVNASRIRQLIRDGRLKAVKLGRDNLIKEPDLDAVRVRKAGYPKGRPRKSE